MNIVVGISHPKHVYMFKNLINSLSMRQHKFLILVVEKDIVCKLLDAFEFEYIRIGVNKKKILNKLLAIIPLTLKVINLSLKFKADIFIGQALPHFAYTSFLLRKKYVIFEDTENSRLLQKIVNPFASSIVVPNSFKNNLGKKQITVKGSYELVYLGSNWFVPDPKVISSINIMPGEKYSIIRFVSWTANHDIGHKGISNENKELLVKEFEKFGKVFISSETELSPYLEKYRVHFEVSQMHSSLFFASLVYGESATMAAEAAYLGTPSIFLNNKGVGYTDELGRNGLVYNFTESSHDQLASITKGVDILQSNTKSKWKKRLEKMLDNQIDVGSFMIWFIENYPESHKIMQENPDYQERFK